MRVGESVRKALKHTVGVREHVVVPEAQDAEALRLEECRSARVRLDLNRVLATIELYDQATLRAAEVHNVGAEGVLATELHAEEAPIAECEPEATFRQRLISS